jgi:outer membrane immunogenic protein
MIAAAAAFVGAGNAAYAADLGGSYKDGPIDSYGPGYSWAGLYIGGSAGFGTGKTETSYEDISLLKYDLDGAVYGAHLGYNLQRGNIVFGVELGINGTEFEGSEQIILPLLTSERELDWYATATARLGYASGSTMFYGFGGVAWADVTTKLGGIIPEALDVSEESEDTHVGWTAGLGIEHALSNNFIVRVEYAHVDLGEGDGMLEGTDVDVTFDTIKIGASYKFGGGHEALK